MGHTLSCLFCLPCCPCLWFTCLKTKREDVAMLEDDLKDAELRMNGKVPTQEAIAAQPDGKDKRNFNREERNSTYYDDSTGYVVGGAVLLAASCGASCGGAGFAYDGGASCGGASCGGASCGA